MNNSTKYLISTTRLGFRQWREDDFDLALNLWGDSEVTKLIDARRTLSETQVQERLAQEITHEAETTNVKTEKEQGIENI